MEQNLLLKIQGLKTNHSPLAESPGNLNIAENIVIDSPNTARSRRGFKKYNTPVTLGTGEKILGMYSYKGTILLNYGSKIAYDNGTGWTDYTGTYDAINYDIGIKSELAQNSIYFTTDTGIKKLDNLGGSIIESGVPRALSADAILTGSTGFFTSDTQVSYRIVWGYKDYNNIVLTGSPSDRIEIANDASGGLTHNVSLRIYIPNAINDTKYFYQVYRSGFSADANSVANDELYLVYESNPTSTDLSNGYIDIIDQTPDSLKGATLYTSPSQEGILQGNDIPPLASDMTYFKNQMLYANTKTPHRLYITLISVGGTQGIQLDDIITINNIAYTAKVTENTALGYFQLFTAGTVAENIAETAKSLVKCINLYNANIYINAYYVSGYNDLPGKILLERDSSSDIAFAVTASSHSTAWNPNLPTSGITVISENEKKGNRVYVSKYQQPESVPITNYIDIGDLNSDIVSIIGLRDSVFVFKDNGYTYRITGNDFNTFGVQLFDKTTNLLAPKSAKVCDNVIYCFTDQGISAVSDSGIALKSWNIEDELIKYRGGDIYPTLGKDSFAISYDSDRKYIFCFNHLMYVYNTVTNCWTKWTIDMVYGFLNNKDDILYLADSTGQVYQERKQYTRFDFADNEYDVNIVSSTQYTIVIDDATNAAVGMTIRQGTGYRYAYITAIDGTTLTVDKILVWSAGAAVLYDPIECSLQWLPIFSENPGIIKRFPEMTVFFRELTDRFFIDYSNNFNSTGQRIEINPEFLDSAWGDLPWGSFAWEGANISSQERRTYFPPAVQRALWQNIKISTDKAFCQFELNGASIVVDNISTRFNN